MEVPHPSSTSRRPMLHGPKQLRSSEEMDSSCSHTFSALAHNVILLEEVLHRGRNFNNVCFECEVSRIKELNLSARYIVAKRFGSGGNEERIVLAPDRKYRWLRLAEVFLEFGIEFYVRGVIQKQIKLNVFVPRTFEQSGIQCVGLRRNTLGIRHTMGVLPARSSRRQNALSECVSILWSGCSPVLSDRVPSITKAVLVCVPVLRNNRRYPVGVGHRQAETSRCAIVKYVDRIAVDFEGLREGLDRQRQLIERVDIVPFGRYFSESEAREVWCDHPVITC